MKITSVNNELVKETAKLLQKKYRNSTKQFLLEGFKCIKEAFDNNIVIEKVFVNEKVAEEYSFIPKDILYEVTEPVLKKISSTDSAPESIAVAKQFSYDKSILKDLKKVILLENIKDVGNLGTIIRSAVAFGTDAIVLYGAESVDLFNPKCVRSTVGNLWKIPVFYIKDIEELEQYFDSFERVATLPRAKKLLKQYQPKLPILLMFGSEADGLSEELINYSTNSVKIEMSDNVESLNLATSVSVIMYTIS